MLQLAGHVELNQASEARCQLAPSGSFRVLLGSRSAGQPQFSNLIRAVHYVSSPVV